MKIEWGNPYTHEEHVRESAPASDVRCTGRCDWCGQTPRTLYNYDRQRRTGGGQAWVCNRECARAYEGNNGQ